MYYEACVNSAVVIFSLSRAYFGIPSLVLEKLSGAEIAGWTASSYSTPPSLRLPKMEENVSLGPFFAVAERKAGSGGYYWVKFVNLI